MSAQGRARGPRNYLITSENGAVDCKVNAGPRATTIARVMAAAGATADPGVTYSIRLGYGRLDIVYEREPLLTYIAKPGEQAYGTPRKRTRR